MTMVLTLPEVVPSQRSRVGGKCLALAEMRRAGISVPETLCISARAYDRYVAATGLRERISMELGRKAFEGHLGPDIRWEELWDASLRIRNLFLRNPLPGDLAQALSGALEPRFEGRAVVVRSSAPAEDSDAVSFAGVHDSFVNVKGIEQILEHVRLVWASLWSDAALLYRRDLGLDVTESAMAVVVQALVRGKRSGVAFSRNPTNPSQAIIESVHGLNQGLVDGIVEPDQWVVDRATGRILIHNAAVREQMLVPAAEGVELEALPATLSQQPPLTAEEVATVFEYSQRLEAVFGAPQDVEWTWNEEGLVVLQSRPITAAVDQESGDDRVWYLSLRRSFENLQSLRARIEGELIPGMIEEARVLAARPVEPLSDSDLAGEIDHRRAIYDGWRDVYWDEFIPFAHGVRLFGQVYNDALHPKDPYAFMDLLAGTEMASLARNRALEEMAAMIRDDPGLDHALRKRSQAGEEVEIDEPLASRMDDFVSRFGDLSCAIADDGHCETVPHPLIRILLEMASHPPAHGRETSGAPAGPTQDELRQEYLRQFDGEERARAAELLDLARTSYQLRDDDNIYLGKIEAQVLAAVAEGRRRLERQGGAGAAGFRGADVAQALRDPSFVPQRSREQEDEADILVRARQLVGQPAGPGVAHGPARVVATQSDLVAFEHGEILVCDAVEPNMTFVVPLAAGVVERRGGMLIHGAIIAREYGLPCVTGVPKATSLIYTGDTVTVDGYLGIVTLRGDDPAIPDSGFS